MASKLKVVEEHEPAAESAWAGIEAVGTCVIVREVAKDAVSKHGILLPAVAQEQPPEGVVLSIGRAAEEKINSEYEVGDHVVFLPHAGTRVTAGEGVVKVMRWDDVIAWRRPK